MIRKNLILLSWALGLTSSLHGLAACPPETTTTPEKLALLHQGLDESYSEEYPAAIETFDQYIKLDPNDPSGYWRKLLAQYSLWRKEQHGNDAPSLKPADYETVIGFTNNGISKADAEIDKNVCPDFNRYVKVEMLGIRAILESKNSKARWLKAQSTLLEAVQIAKQSHYQDVGFFLGSVNYKTAEHKYFFQVASLLPHDKEKGRAMIFAAAAKNNSLFADDIWFFIFSMENNPSNRQAYTGAEIKQLWTYLSQKYPRNHFLIEFGKTHNY